MALSRHTPLQSHTPLRRRARLKSKPRGRSPLADEYLEANPWCERCLHLHGKQRRALQVHHIIHGYGRRRDDPSNFAALCLRCHCGNVGPVHEHPERERDLLLRIKDAKGEVDG